LRHAALAFARLCDPEEMRVKSRQACHQITTAMTTHPEMISGANEFDCRLMLVTRGRMVCKRGAEGYLAIGIMPGVISEGSPGIGVAFKVSDGDVLFRTINIEPKNRVRPAVTLEILRQIGALRPEELSALSDFGPSLPVKNNRGTTVGISRPVFQLSAEG
jgi:L-asparaginase II